MTLTTRHARLAIRRRHIPAAMPATPVVAATAARTAGTAGASDTSLRSALTVLTTLGPPLTIATTLMLYFGWARSAKQASAMGLDVSLFGYSKEDYVLRSISTLFIPLLLLAALALGWLALHQRVSRALHDQRTHLTLGQWGRGARAAGLLVAGASILLVTLDRGGATLVAPLSLALGSAVAAYGAWLLREAADRSPAPQAAWVGALRSLLVGGLITLALFWELSGYAGVVGRGYALDIARSVSSLPRAIAFSPTQLGIQAPGVVEERLAAPAGAAPGAVRYRTTGLRLLVRSGGRFFLLHDGWTPQSGSVVVLPDDSSLRWQFSR